MEIHHVLKGAGEGDSISIENSGYVWVDHCELYNVYDGDESKKDVYDGLLDCKKNSHHLTYSYNYLHDSWKTMLCGFSDSDNYDRTFTMHHNIFENCNSRLPLFRFGHAHIYNNYYHDIYTSGINTRMGAEVFVENNIFDNVREPVCSLDSKAIGYWNLSGNQFIGCTAANTSTETSQSWSENMANTSTYKPDYAYTAEGTDTLLDTLKNSAAWASWTAPLRSHRALLRRLPLQPPLRQSPRTGDHHCAPHYHAFRGTGCRRNLLRPQWF